MAYKIFKKNVNNLKARKLQDKILKYVFLMCVLFCLLFLLFLGSIISVGVKNRK